MDPHQAPKPEVASLKDRVDYLIEVIYTKMSNGDEERARKIRLLYQALKQHVSIEQGLEFAIQQVLKMKFEE